MEAENCDFKSIMDARRKSVENSIRPISIDELKSLEESLFRDAGDVWYEPFRQFVDENRHSTFFHATADDQIQVVYCREKEKGIWFIPERAIGILDGKPLEILKVIVDAR